jgi:hypothetical protein
LQKPSWQLRGELFRGTFYLAKGKAFETGGEISNFENASWNYILISLAIFQNNLKGLLQKICKNKLSGANVVQNVKIEESNHIYLDICRNSFNWFNSK